MRPLRGRAGVVLSAGWWLACRCEFIRSGWPDNPSWRNLVAWCWRLGEGCRLVVVNLSAKPSQGLVRLPWGDMHDKSISLDDLFSDARYSRQGNEMTEPGLFVDLPAWGYHFFKFCVVA